MARPTDPLAPKRLSDGCWQHLYGLVSPVKLTPWQLELYCWHHRFASGVDPVEHLRRAIAIIEPESLWHSWREERFRALCNDSLADRIGNTIVRNLPWVGPGAAGKTNDAGVFSFYFWLMDPTDTIVALTSTGKQKMRQRVWPIIQESWRSFKGVAGEDYGPHMLNSTMELQAIKGDSKHAIFGQAVEQGELGAAVERLKGVHARRVMLVIDEAPGTPEAIFATIPNMLKGAQEVIIVCTGNGPLTHFDPFSRVCRPVGGWKSISADTESWRTAPVPEFQLPAGTCLHFDGKNSPNVRAKRTIYPFLYTWEDWQRVTRDPNIQRSAQFYSQDRGFWPPEGFLRTVLTEEMIEQGGARGEMAFAGPTTPIGALDPGFGGDACVLRFGRMGKLASGKYAVQADDQIIIPILVDAVDKDGKRLPAEYQIAQFIRPEAEKRGVKPHCFGVEATGTGRGAAAVLLQEWGEIIPVESGGKPSDLPASEEDPRPSNQVYDRKITELWYSVQAFVKGGQLGGLTEDDCVQFCARQYDYVAKKYILEKKEDLKERLGRSPDNADSLSVLVNVARLLGMHTRGPRGDRLLSMWDSEILLQSKLFAEDALYLPEESPG